MGAEQASAKRELTIQSEGHLLTSNDICGNVGCSRNMANWGNLRLKLMLPRSCGWLPTISRTSSGFQRAPMPRHLPGRHERRRHRRFQCAWKAIAASKGWVECLFRYGTISVRPVSIWSRAPGCSVRRSAAGRRVGTSRRVACGKFERGSTEGRRDHCEKEEIDGFHDTYLSVTCSGRITSCRIRRSRRHYRTACRNCDNCEQDVGEKLGHG